ncbi:formyltransferase family protein [bacterium]|nr:formyltransferase family protein [bacterium]
MIIFAYNFHHQKTQDVLFYCHHHGFVIDAVLAADWRDLGIPPKVLRTDLRTFGTIHPAELCASYDIPYYIMAHNSDDVVDLLVDLKPEVGLIAGARILSPQVISAFEKGIINIHPGLIPEVRGLDCVEWAIYEGSRLGVTSHLIDRRIDAGRIIQRVEIPEYLDDTLIDLYDRLYRMQLKILIETIETVLNSDADSFVQLEHDAESAKGLFPLELIPGLTRQFSKRFPNAYPLESSN